MTSVITNAQAYMNNNMDYLQYLKDEKLKNIQDEVYKKQDTSLTRLKNVIGLGPLVKDEDKEINNIMQSMFIHIGELYEDENDETYKITPSFILDYGIDSDYGKGYYYNLGYMIKKYNNGEYILVKEHKSDLDDEYLRGFNYGGGSRRNKASPKHDEMTMKDIKEMCKANEIKLSKVVEGKRVAFKKKELITKLKRKKLL